MAQMAEVDRFGHAIYSWQQVEQFFDRISLPQKYRDHPALERKEATRSKEGGEFLALLHRYTLAAVPFESLELHYSPHHIINLDPQYLFHKIVERGFGRGGYCFESNTLFLIILRTIGYDVYPVGARLSDVSETTVEAENWRGPKYSAWSHMVNIVTIEGQKYLVDVGFGSNNPHFLIPLKHGVVRDTTFCFKVSKESIPDLSSSGAEQALWVYEYWHINLNRFMPAYCFTEMEFTPADFEMMNLWTSTSRASLFTYTVICTKMILREDEQPFPTIYGHVTLVGNKVKKVLEGASEDLVVLESERDRIRALKKHLDVMLSEAEKNGIRGMVTELA